MTSRNSLGMGLAILCLALLGRVSLAANDAPTKTSPVRIGLVSSLFIDVPEPLVKLASGPFNALMKEFTGLEGQLTMGGEVFEVAGRLNRKELDLAVFHGVEYGWVRQKYPELQPLMIAINKHSHCRAHLVVKADSEVKCFADLKGKDLSLPMRSKIHCRMFLDRICADCGQCSPKAFFQNVVSSPNTEIAFEDVLSGKIPAVVVDSHQLEFFEWLKPQCFARLKAVQNSDLFPSAVVVYRKGALDDATLKKFKDGMLSANQNRRGRGLMAQWSVTSFEPVPEDYDRVLADILKAYPAPTEVKTTSK
ncbi:MAG: PhnD/SsuA/transferrin family substrate-binding protein [Planctomycetes bacterium]|nr:PhnD/SsuA/transferrin family substrate-binding protein [Planctomycetota bacterium]